MTYVHSVYFTFKPTASETDMTTQIADGKAMLARIPTVRQIETGRRDQTVNRDVSMTDFDVGLTVLFDDKAGLDAYSNHPLHLEYVNKHKANWTAIRVCDFLTD